MAAFDSLSQLTRKHNNLNILTPFVGHVRGQNFAAASFALDWSRAVHVQEGTCGINVGDCTERSLQRRETKDSF